MRRLMYPILCFLYSLAAIVACIGTGLPTDILITTAVALTAGGLPLDDIGIIIAVDWIL